MLIGSESANKRKDVVERDEPDTAREVDAAREIPAGPASASAPVATSTSGPGRSWLRVVLGVAVLAALVVELVVLLSARDKINQQNALDSARSSALAAARAYSVEVASYDYRHLAQDFQQVEQHSTAAFRATFRQSSNAINGALTQYHAVAAAHVVAAGLESATAGRAVIAVFIDQTVTNTTQKVPTTDQSRIEMTLVRQHGQWLIDQLKLL